MTPQEAIETLKIAIAEVEWNYPMNYAVAFENAIESLEKQIPKKAELTEDCCICPSCTFDMMGVYDFTDNDTKDPAYCPTCGQALDLGDSE